VRLIPLTLLGLVGAGLAPAGLPAAAPPATLRGQIGGELHVGPEEAALVVPWTVEVQQADSGAAELQFAAQLFGADVRARVQQTEGGEVRWKVQQAEWAVTELIAQSPATLPAALASLQWEGRLRLHGEGGWTEEGPSGPLQVTWAEGAVRGNEPELAVEGLEAAFELQDWFSEPRSGQGALRFASATVAGIELRQAVVALALQPDGSMQIGPGRMNALEGQLVVAPIVWPTEGPLTITVQAVGLSLARLAAFAPQMVRAATGTVSGHVVLQWDEEGGLEPIDGHLVIDSQRDVELTMGPRPGFLTRQVPRRYEFLPSWMGSFGRRLAPVNPAYEMLEGIELGRLPLRVRRLEIEFFPPDDPMQRTARIEIEGRPTTGEVIESLTIQLNLSGPLADIIRLGLDDRAQISGRLSSPEERAEVPR
jgi:hypothetical protein